MSLNVDHLIEQAEGLVQANPTGAPRQADLRRAISTAYYAVFHFVLTAAADEFIGVSKRNTRPYTLLYRSIDHRQIKDLCSHLQKPQLPQKYEKFAPRAGFGENMRSFASAFTDLQDKRHAADYDPSYRVTRLDARLVIDTARSAIRRFQRASSGRQRAFLSLLLFQPR